MNSINLFSSKKKFPLSTQAIDFLQNMVKQAYHLARIGGSDNHILEGCVNTTGNTWTSGYVIIAGELLPFIGGTGTLISNVRIKETKADAVANYDTYTDAYLTRYVEFGSNVGGADTFVWNTFTVLKSNAEIVRDFATKAELDAVRLLVMPRGAIIEYDITNNPLPLPVGWVFAGGTTVAGYGIVPNKKGRISVGFNPNSSNLPLNVIDQRNTDGSVIENYGAVGNMGGKSEVTLGNTNIPELVIKARGGADDGNFSNQDSLSGSDKPGGDGWSFDYKIGNANPKSIENRMPYVVTYSIVKVV